MIERYSDHAAMSGHFCLGAHCDRIMAFGFLVQKFDLFLRIAASSLAARPLAAGSQIVGEIAGLLLIVLGGVMMALAAVRFRKTTLEIDAKEVRPGPGALLDITLVALLLLPAVAKICAITLRGCARARPVPYLPAWCVRRCRRAAFA